MEDFFLLCRLRLLDDWNAGKCGGADDDDDDDDDSEPFDELPCAFGVTISASTCS